MMMREKCGMLLFSLGLAATPAAVHAGAFSDGFEGAEFDLFWTVSDAAGPVELSPFAHSGAQSVLLGAVAGQNGGGGLWHPFAFEAQGSVSVWVYDNHPGEQTRYCHVTLYYSQIDYGQPGSYFAAGIEDWGPDYYYVTDPATGQQIQTDVPRSEGWHLFEIHVGDEAGEFRIDGQTVHTFAGGYVFDSVNLEVLGPWWRPTATYFFDDFSIIARPAGDSGAEIAASRFDSGPEGWFLTGDPISFVPEWQAIGGNPGGCIRADEHPHGVNKLFHAPSEYLGNKLGSYGHTLSFDLQQQSGNTQTSDGKWEVSLYGADLRLVIDAGPNPAFEPDWTCYLVTLTESAGWRIGEVTGPTPTREEFEAVLADLDSLQIMGEFSHDEDYVRLDNVVLRGEPCDALIGDLDSDGDVDLVDFAEFQVHFGSSCLPQ